MSSAPEADLLGDPRPRRGSRSARKSSSLWSGSWRSTTFGEGGFGVVGCSLMARSRRLRVLAEGAGNAPVPVAGHQGLNPGSTFLVDPPSKARVGPEGCFTEYPLRAASRCHDGSPPARFSRCPPPGLSSLRFSAARRPQELRP